jgi:TPR repeat protein
MTYRLALLEKKLKDLEQRQKGLLNTRKIEQLSLEQSIQYYKNVHEIAAINYACYELTRGDEKSAIKSARFFYHAFQAGYFKTEKVLADALSNQEFFDRREFTTKKEGLSIEIALCHLLGLGRYELSINRFKAIAEQLAKQNDCEALYLQGLMYAEQKDYVSAHEYMSTAAEKGHSLSCLYLGNCYTSGINGYPADHKLTARWLKKPAIDGIAIAQRELAHLYYIGHGVLKDKHRAYEWYRSAATDNSAENLFSLGFCYLNGAGVEKDLQIAARWFFKASTQGHELAINQLSDSDNIIFQFYHALYQKNVSLVVSLIEKNPVLCDELIAIDIKQIPSKFNTLQLITNIIFLLESLDGKLFSNPIDINQLIIKLIITLDKSNDFDEITDDAMALLLSKVTWSNVGSQHIEKLLYVLVDSWYKAETQIVSSNEIADISKGLYRIKSLGLNMNNPYLSRHLISMFIKLIYGNDYMVSWNEPNLNQALLLLSLYENQVTIPIEMVNKMLGCQLIVERSHIVDDYDLLCDLSSYLTIKSSMHPDFGLYIDMSARLNDWLAANEKDDLKASQYLQQLSKSASDLLDFSQRNAFFSIKDNDVKALLSMLVNKDYAKIKQVTRVELQLIQSNPQSW